ncbi:MAG: extracellular solute-binding protein [Phycisphaerae bacterium]|nr:extracellular solute-binding protein [Phycisphaerae bacterium]
MEDREHTTAGLVLRTAFWTVVTLLAALWFWGGLTDAQVPAETLGRIGHVFKLGILIIVAARVLVALATRTLRSEIKFDIAVSAVVLVVWSFAWVVTRPWRLAAERGDQVELVLMNWSGGGGQKEEQIVANLIAEFERTHPNIRVKRINPGDSGSYNTKLQTMMAAEVPPDIFYMGSERFAKFAKSGQLARIEDFIKQDRDAGRETLNLDDFFTNTVDCFRFDGEVSGRGVLYGIPKDFTTWGFYYNKSRFDEAGLTYPNDLPREEWTWDKFAEYARKLGALPGMLGGAEFSTWDDPIRAYLWTYGVDVVDDDFNSRLFDPVVRDRLATLRAWRFSEKNTLVSGDSQVAQGQDIFVTGRVGMVGPLGRWVVPTYRAIRDFDWDFAPMPRGTQPANLVATVAWSIGSKSKHPAEAWKLLKFLCGAEGQARAAELGLAIPTLRSVAYGPSFTQPDQKPQHDNVYLEQAEYAQIARIPGYPEWKDNLSKRLDQLLKSGRSLAVDDILHELEADWQRDRENPIRRTDYPALRWGVVAAIVLVPLALVLAIVGTVWWWHRPGRIALKEEISGYGFVSPWFVGFCVFMAFPIVMSFVLAFSKWSGVSPLREAQWVGLANFRHLLFNDPTFWTSLKVTAYYALFAVPIGQIIALIMALLLNHELKFSGFFRSALYLPSVLAGVGIAILWRWVFDGEVGLMNGYLLTPLFAVLNPVVEFVGPSINWLWDHSITTGWNRIIDAANAQMGTSWAQAPLDGVLPTHLTPPRWFTDDAKKFGPPAFAIMSFWAMGGTMVIYLAGLKGIPKELYEAASIDGSSIFQRFRNITLPMLSPIIFFNGIMAIIGSFQVFTQAFVMTGGGPGDDTRFYVLYLYNLAFDRSHMGYASAMAWLLLVIILTLTLVVMRGSKRFVYYEALK